MSKKVSCLNLIMTEYKKIFYLRFSRVYLISLILSSLVLGIIFSLTLNVTQGKAITELPSMDIISTNMLGVDLANLMLIVFTALLIANEFSTKLIHVSLAVTPNRRRFFLGKLLSYFLLSVVISMVIVLLIYLTSLLILLINNMPIVSLLDSSLNKFVIGVMILPIFYSIITTAAVFIFNGSGGAITFSLIVLAMPAMIKMFSLNIQKILLPFFPQSAIHSISAPVEKGSPESIGIIPAIIVLLTWIMLMSLIALFKFRKRDI